MTDARNAPLYRVTEAAHLLRISPATLSDWIRPRHIELADRRADCQLISPPTPNRLSFFNLVDAFIIKELHLKHEVPLRSLCVAKCYAQLQLGIEDLFVREDLKTANGQLFLDGSEDVVNLGRVGQLGLKPILDQILDRIEYKDKFASKIFPYINGSEARSIYISPFHAFGKPVVSQKCISTRAVAERYELGEPKEEIAKDYGIGLVEVDAAIQFEQAA